MHMISDEVGFGSVLGNDSWVQVDFGLQSSGFYQVITLGLPSGFGVLL